MREGRGVLLRGQVLASSPSLPFLSSPPHHPLVPPHLLSPSLFPKQIFTKLIKIFQVIIKNTILLINYIIIFVIKKWNILFISTVYTCETPVRRDSLCQMSFFSRLVTSLLLVRRCRTASEAQLLCFCTLHLCTTLDARPRRPAYHDVRPPRQRPASSPTSHLLTNVPPPRQRPTSSRHPTSSSPTSHLLTNIPPPHLHQHPTSSPLLTNIPPPHLLNIPPPHQHPTSSFTNITPPHQHHTSSPTPTSHLLTNIPPPHQHPTSSPPNTYLPHPIVERCMRQDSRQRVRELLAER